MSDVGKPFPSADRRITMQDVGRIAGVSQVTVSRALSNPAKVSEQTLLKVRNAVEVTGFVPNAVAGALASRRSRLVSALIPSITNVVYSSMVRSFSRRLRASGYQILLSETGLTPAGEEEAVMAHLSRMPDAIVLTGIHHTPRVRRMLLGASIPVVELWDVTDTPIDLCVGFHHVDAARAAAVFALGRDYRQAATITAADERARRRQAGFASHFSSCGGGEVTDIDVGGPASIAAGRRALADLLERGAMHRHVVYCSSDIIAHGVMIEARSRRLAVPSDLAIIGFGDQEFARHLDPPLTTVRIDFDRLGQNAADAILGRLQGGPATPAVSDLGYEVVDRSSA